MNSIVQALKNLPEVRLRIIDLAWSVTREDGAIDTDKVCLRGREIVEASEEARAYSDNTKKAVSWLKNMARSRD